MVHILTNIRDFLWGYPSLFLLGGYGLLITVSSKIFPITGLGASFAALRGIKNDEKDGISPLMSLSTALGGTVGVGSIIGVAYAISTGGVGVLFWMWVSAFLGMMTKFSECALAVKYRDRKDDHFVGGAPYILKKSGHAKMAATFAVLCILTSFGTGNLTQINGLSDVLAARGINAAVTATLGFIVIFIIVIKGQKIIGKANEIMMPFASTIYLILIFFIIVKNISFLPSAILSIIKEAFGLRAISGGIAGSVIIRSFRVGFSKGVFSHEAGMGTSPIAHASGNGADPFLQGIFGMFEVFFDTFIVGTMTGLAIIVSGEGKIDSMFRVYFGNLGDDIFIGLLAIFVIAAMISWCFYAESCLHFLCKKNWVTVLYRATFSLCTIIGAMISSNLSWVISDILNIFMIVPNIFILLIKHGEIIDIIERGRKRRNVSSVSHFISMNKRRTVNERGINNN